MRRAGGIAGARLHLGVDLGEGLRELGLEAADLRLHRVEDVLVHLEGGMWGVNRGVNGGVKGGDGGVKRRRSPRRSGWSPRRRPSVRSSGRRGRPRTLRTCRSHETWSSGAARRGGSAAAKGRRGEGCEREGEVQGRRQGGRRRGGGVAGARLHILVGERLLGPLGRGRARGAALDGGELAARAGFRAARVRALARRLRARLERLDVRRLEVRGAVGGVDIEEEVRPLPLCLALLLALLEAEAARRAAGQLRERPPPLHAGGRLRPPSARTSRGTGRAAARRTPSPADVGNVGCEIWGHVTGGA